MTKVALAFLISIGPVVAEEGVASRLFGSVPPADFVDAFIGLCVSNPGRIDKVAAAARTLEYADLPEDMALMLSPQAPDANFKGWLSMQGVGSPFLLGTSEGPFKGRIYQFCALSNPYMDSDAIMPRVEALLELGQKFSDDTVAGQRMRGWLIPSIQGDAFLTINDMVGMGYSGVTISISAPKE